MRFLVNILKNWTLPVSIIGGSVIYLIFANVKALEGASQVFGPIFDAVLPWFLFLILFVTFCKVDFKEMRLQKWHFWVCLFQVLFVAVVVGLILYLKIEGNDLIVAQCLLSCIIGPCAAASAVVTHKLGGNLESMTTFTLVSNFLSALMIPLVFPHIHNQSDMAFWPAFFEILERVCVILIVPMGLAFLVKHYLPRLHRLIVGVRDLSFYMWGCSLSIVTGITLRNILNADASVAFLLTIVVVTFVLCVIQFAVGRYLGRFFGCAIESGQALGQKNTAFAIWIAGAHLNPLSTVGPGCYILWQNAVNSLELWEQRRNLSNQDAEANKP